MPSDDANTSPDQPPAPQPPEPQSSAWPTSPPPAYPPSTGAPPSQPLWPGYSYAAPPTGPVWQPPYAHPTPPTPPSPPSPPRRVGLIVGIVSGAVALLLIGCCAISVFALQPTLSGAATIATPTALATDTPLPTPTYSPTPTPLPTATVGPTTLLYVNDFTGQATGWPNNSNCRLGSDGFHVKSGCAAPVNPVANVDVIVKLKQISGPTNYPYGVVFRYQEQGQKFYGVAINSIGQWQAYRCSGTTTNQGSTVANCKFLIGLTTNSAIHRGRGVTNTLEVRAKGSTFTVYVNKTKVGSFKDSTFTTGYVGLDTAVNSEAVFTYVSISRIN